MTTLGAAIGKKGRDAMRHAAKREARMRYAPIEFKADEDKDGRLFFEGMANTINPDRVREIVNPTAFRRSLKSYLKFNPQLFYNHDWSLSVGSITEAKITDKGLWVRGFVQPAEDDKGQPLFGELGEFIRFVRGQIKRGQIRTLSIGFRLLDSKPKKFKDPLTGKEVEGREVTNLDLLENSLVTVPANRESAIEVRDAMAAIYGEDIAKSMIQVEEDPEYLKQAMGEGPDDLREYIQSEVQKALANDSTLLRGDGTNDEKALDDADDGEPGSEGKATDTDDYEVTPLDFGDEYEVKSLFGGSDDE